MAIPTFEINNSNAQQNRYVIYKDGKDVTLISLNDNLIEGVKIYDNLDSDSLSSLTANESGIDRNNIEISLVVEDDRSLVVPAEFYGPQTSQALESWVNNNSPKEVFKEYLEAHNAYVIYNFEQSVITSDHGKISRVTHANSGFVKAPAIDANAVYCIFRHRKLKLIVFKNYGLQLIQNYDFVAPADAVYHILNALQLNGLQVKATKVFISGLVEKESALYKEMDRFIPELLDLPPADGITFSEAFNDFPQYYFNYLTYLV